MNRENSDEISDLSDGIFGGLNESIDPEFQDFYHNYDSENFLSAFSSSSDTNKRFNDLNNIFVQKKNNELSEEKEKESQSKKDEQEIYFINECFEEKKSLPFPLPSSRQEQVEEKEEKTEVKFLNKKTERDSKKPDNFSNKNQFMGRIKIIQTKNQNEKDKLKEEENTILENDQNITDNNYIVSTNTICKVKNSNSHKKINPKTNKIIRSDKTTKKNIIVKLNRKIINNMYVAFNSAIKNKSKLSEKLKKYISKTVPKGKDAENLMKKGELKKTFIIGGNMKKFKKLLDMKIYEIFYFLKIPQQHTLIQNKEEYKKVLIGEIFDDIEEKKAKKILKLTFREMLRFYIEPKELRKFVGLKEGELESLEDTKKQFGEDDDYAKKYEKLVKDYEKNLNDVEEDMIGDEEENDWEKA